MDIYQDIERATHIPFVEDNAVFFRKRQRRQPPRRIPRNAHLVDDCMQHSYYEEEDKHESEEPRTINPLEIEAAIRMAKGTISCSQVEVDEYFRARQNASSGEESTSLLNDTAFNITKKSESPNTSCSNTGSADTSQSTRSDDLSGSSEVRRQDTVLKSCKLHRNAAIKGLLKNRKISVKDLADPNKEASFGPDDQAPANSNDDQADQPNTSLEMAQGLDYVPCPGDPDILMTRLQAFGLDASKHKHIDFTVPRLGTKVTVTPLEYHIYEIDDESFNFVKKPSAK